MGTYFYDTDGKRIASEDTIIPIPLVKGMKITIHGHEESDYVVYDWNFHKGHEDEEAGLRIILQDKNAPSIFETPGQLSM